MRIKPIASNMTELVLNDGTQVLFSYQTPVACIGYYDNGDCFVFKTEKKWSSTTSRHINKYLSHKWAKPMPQEYFDNLVKGV